MPTVTRKPRTLNIEPLEVRQVLSATGGALDQLVTPHLLVSPDAGTSAVQGMTPAQVETAYGFNNIMFGSVVGNGSGQTIAIVDAYNDPNIASDLAKFDQQFGLAAPPSFNVVSQSGSSKLPHNDRGWASEIALDVEWAHAIAPGANILLVEASSAYTSDLDRALDYARKGTGVVVVSNSWGGSEYSGESSEDVHFTTPAGHPGVTFTVAAGDDGTPAEYPSSSPDVLSIGGTNLRISSGGDYLSESVWSDGGGGSSRYEGLPSYQTGLGITNRGTPDVSYNADPNAGVAVYDSYGSGGWAVFGGTSAGAPQWAALIAIADQGRSLAGKGSLANVQSVLYTLPRSDFHDITSGSNGSAAKAGYDVASGLGTPIANSVIRDLVAYSGLTNFTVAAATSTSRGGGFHWGGFFFGFNEPGGGGSTAAGGPAAGTASLGGMIAPASSTATDGSNPSSNLHLAAATTLRTPSESIALTADEHGTCDKLSSPTDSAGDTNTADHDFASAAALDGFDLTAVDAYFAQLGASESL